MLLCSFIYIYIYIYIYFFFVLFYISHIYIFLHVYVYISIFVYFIFSYFIIVFSYFHNSFFHTFLVFCILYFNFSIICVSDYVLLYMWLNVCVWLYVNVCIACFGACVLSYLLSRLSHERQGWEGCLVNGQNLISWARVYRVDVLWNIL